MRILFYRFKNDTLSGIAGGNIKMAKDVLTSEEIETSTQEIRS